MDHMSPVKDGLWRIMLSFSGMNEWVAGRAIN